MRPVFKRSALNDSVAEAGFGAIQAVAALGLVATVLAGAMGGIGMAARASLAGDTAATSNIIALSQMENIKAHAYILPPGPYPLLDVPPGYSVQALVMDDVPGGLSKEYIERIQVNVFKDGRLTRTLSGYKASRCSTC